MSNIWDNFDRTAEEVGPNDVVLQFGTNKVRISLEDAESPQSLGEAFRRFASDLGTSPEAEVRFRAVSGVLSADSRLEAGATYVAAVQADTHG